MNTQKLIIPLIFFSGLIVLTGMVVLNNRENQNKQYYFYEDPMECSGCHWDRFERWSVSQHSKGFTGDFFQAQYYELVLPSLGLDEKLADAHEGCIGCHSPSAYLSGDMIPPRTAEPDNHWNPAQYTKTRADRGIFCDFCHTLDRFENDPPFNHDYISHATAEVDPKGPTCPFPGPLIMKHRCQRYMRPSRYVPHAIMSKTPMMYGLKPPNMNMPKAFMLKGAYPVSRAICSPCRASRQKWV